MVITLVPYDPNWPTLFEAEKLKLKNKLGNVIAAIEHIGSTAVPGIYAKPIIDILIGVYDLEKINNEHIHKIESLGYRYIQTYEKDIPYRRFFIKNDSDGNRSHHTHLVNYHSAWWQRHLLFRNYLKKNHDDAKAYEKLKLTLAETLNAPLSNNKLEDNLYKNYIHPYPALAEEYQKLRKTLGSDFTLGNQYAVAKSFLIQSINIKAYFDFTLHLPDVTLNQLHGYIPQLTCLELYKEMFRDSDFVRCYGVELNTEHINKILERDINHWDQYSFGPYAWFDKLTQEFIGRGGLNHTVVNDHKEIELTYSLSKKFWGRGLAIEIGQFSINYAFNILKLDNIICFTMTNNHQSLRVIEKLNFQYEKDFIHHNLPHKLFRLKNPKTVV